MESYYDILQVSPKAEPAVITAAYKRLAQTYHPDAIQQRISQLKAQIDYHRHRYYGLDSPEISDVEYDGLVNELKHLQNPLSSATERMADINEAYEVLSDPVKRASYDKEIGTGSETQDAGGRHVSDEEVMTNLFRFAAEEAAAGKKRHQVADTLTRNGVPYDIAHIITERVFKYRSKLRGKEGKKSMGCGLAMLIVGGLITGITYLAASGPGGGTYVVTTGLFIVGTITLIAGIIQYLRS